MRLILLINLFVVLCFAEHEDALDETSSKDVERRGTGDSVGYDYTSTKSVSPDLWAKIFPDACAGDTQSPINLKNAEKMECDPFKFTGYDKKPDKMKVENNGHTVVVTFEMDPMPTVQGGCLPHTYTFAQFHFHWGKNDKKGSEHKIDGKQYPMEIHLVHYNGDDFGSITEAVASKKSDALAVLGAMVDIGNNGKPYGELTSLLSKIKNAGETAKLKPGIKLSQFLPSNTDLFYRYMGSLTTPKCYEIVVWTVFKKATKIKKSHMGQFRKLRDTYGNTLVDNFRPVQKLKGRTVKST